MGPKHSIIKGLLCTFHFEAYFQSKKDFCQMDPHLSTVEQRGMLI